MDKIKHDLKETNKKVTRSFLILYAVSPGRASRRASLTARAFSKSTPSSTHRATRVGPRGRGGGGGNRRGRGAAGDGRAAQGGGVLGQRGRRGAAAGNKGDVYRRRGRGEGAYVQCEWYVRGRWRGWSGSSRQLLRSATRCSGRARISHRRAARIPCCPPIVCVLPTHFT
jgi:hypothetical protein